MANREKKKSGAQFFLKPGLLAQEREKKEGDTGNKIVVEKRDSIFISHISEEAPIALLLQQLLASIFKDIPVFVSSDYESIPSGKEWYDKIVESARSAKIVIVLLSKQSVHQPWINFEAGIGAGAYAEVIPLVGRNISRDDMPPPLTFRQTRDLRNPKEVETLLRDVAHVFNRAEPIGDWSNFMNEVGAIMRKLPYQGLLLEPYCIHGENGERSSYDSN